MDTFGGLGFAWLVSTLLTLAVGCYYGRANDALTLGVLLGPVGLLLAIRWLPRHRSGVAKQPVTLPIRASTHRPRF